MFIPNEGHMYTASGTMKLNPPTILAVVVLVLFMVSRVAMPAIAQSTYSIPLEGGKWNTQTISVYVPTTPTADYNIAVHALGIWNRSMLWFTNTYYPNTTLYSFTLSDQNSPVKVEFVAIDFLPAQYECGDEARGCYVPMVISNGTIQSVSVTIATQWPALEVQTVILHEFGHVLGLNNDNYKTDFMYGAYFTAGVQNVGVLPSTLDLYGVYVLKTGASLTYATLPSNIPYTTVPAKALSEFPVVPLLSLGLFVLLNGRDRKRQPEHT